MVTSAHLPIYQPDVNITFNSHMCMFGAPSGPSESTEFPLCCEPPSRFNQKWPVEPKYLWSDYYDDEDDDISWDFANNFGNNNEDTIPHDQKKTLGTTRTVVFMLDGPPRSINDAFHKQFTVVTREEPSTLQKRTMITTNQTVLDSVFDHSEETFRVYCNSEKTCRS